VHGRDLAASHQRLSEAPAHERASRAAIEARHYTAVRTLPDRVGSSDEIPNLSVAIIIRIARRPFP